MISFTTFQDVLDHGVDYLGGNPSDQAKRDCVRAALESYRDIANAFNWTYLYTWSRILTTESYDSTVAGATVTYLESSGTYPNQLTITGDTWPTWAANGIIRFGGTLNQGDNGPGYSTVDLGPDVSNVVNFRIAQRISATVVTLDPIISPNADITTPIPFMMYQDTYLLPEDFVAQDASLYELNFGGMQYTHPREWLYENRYVFAAGIPQFFTITGDQKYPGRLVTRMFPWPYQSKSVDFIYKRRPRRLITQSYSTGTVSATAGSATLTGVGTVFTPGMVGSVFRLSGTAKPPTSMIMGTNPPVFESTIMSYVSATSVVIADPLDASYSGSGFVVSDPIDVEQGAMLNAYLRCVEKHIGMSRTLKDKPSAAKQYLEALAEAKSADSRSFAGRAAGSTGRYHPRLRDMPMGPDQP